MENHGYNNVIGSSSAPYINSLASTYGLATNYFATDHPSLPNYLEATTGGSQGVSNDNDPPANVTGAPSIFSQLPNGQSRSLMEGMPANCYTSDSGNYVVRHNPEAYLSSVSGGCKSFDVPFGSSPDLSAEFTFISPNLIDDMHNGTVADGDNFLKQYVPQLMATPQYQAGNTAIFIVWDEDGSEDGLDQENNHVPCIVISPNTHSVRDGTSYTHYSLLRTAEQLLGLPLLGNAASANSMLGRFGF
jgi:phosphatidylinositol-3-phosphatase